MTYRFVSDAALRVGQIALLGEAFVRGLNYIVTPPAQLVALNHVEASAPAHVWGVLFIGFAVMGWFGEALLSGTEHLGPNNPRAWPSFLAHSALMCIYLSMTFGAMADVLQLHPRYGWLNVYDLLGMCVANWIFARRRRRDA